MKRILTIAGSDSGGGAGIQADIKTITVLGGYGMSVIAALTAQNTLGVQGIHEVPVDFIRLQMESVLSDIGADAVKTGMLATPEIVAAVAEGVRAYGIETLVVDPVMVATSGDRLLTRDAVETVIARLLPLASIVTPNTAEAALLSGSPVETMEGMKTAARVIHGFGPQYVLIKGGHFERNGDLAVDLLFDGQGFRTFEAPRIETKNTHGTGCTLSAAIAVYLAQGLPAEEAVKLAKAFISKAIKGSLSLGGGRGPTNPYVQVKDQEDRAAVLETLRQALERLMAMPVGYLVPEIRSNLGYALAGASGYSDVAGIPGRISQIGNRVITFADPAFGATRHIARVIMAAMIRYPQMRSAMALRYNAEILAACESAGFDMVSFDRRDEPRDVKEREGSSLEWGTRQALKLTSAAPDVIYDEGGDGKEPIIRLLGRDPLEVVDKLVRIHRRVLEKD